MKFSRGVGWEASKRGAVGLLFLPIDGQDMDFSGFEGGGEPGLFLDVLEDEVGIMGVMDIAGDGAAVEMIGDIGCVGGFNHDRLVDPF